MLMPSVVLDAVLDSLRSIPELVAELGGPAVPPTQSIQGHYIYTGQENALNRMLAEMPDPSMIVAYVAQMGGNFDAATMWKHRLLLYVRARNSATDGLTNHTSLSAPDLYTMALNYPITVPEPARSIRYVELCGGNLTLMDTPTGLVQSDELGQDFWYGTLTFPEVGDVGPDGVEVACAAT